MKKRAIRTIAGLQRVWDAHTKRFGRLYRQPYILAPALARNLARFDELERIADPGERFIAFRHIPPLEYDLKAEYDGLTPEHRRSLAQQGRARHRRTILTEDGLRLPEIIFNLLQSEKDPWALKAKQYWGLLIDRLRANGLNPTVVPQGLAGEKLEYEAGGKRRSLSSGQFHNLISRERKRLSRLN
jgi:hypothetical protein